MGRAVNTGEGDGLPVGGVSRDEQARMKHALDNVAGLELAVLVGTVRRGAAELVVSGVPVEQLGALEVALAEATGREITAWTLDGMKRDPEGYARMLEQGLPLVETGSLWGRLKAGA